MKHILNISFAICLLALSTSCDDEYLDRFPETAIGKENFFNTEEDLSIYVNNLYNFPGNFIYTADRGTDNQAFTGEVEIKTLMTTNPSSATITSGWNWEQLRTINFFLENVENADLTQDRKDHYAGIARFFRANFYMDKVKRFSDVPWYDQTIGTNDEELLFKGRDSREMVVGKIFEDYQFASDKVDEFGLPGAVNKWVVKSMMARAAIYEGTFRRYHEELGLQGSAASFIQIARDITMEIINSGQYEIHNTGNPNSDYYDLFVSTSLESNAEVILPNLSLDNLKNSGNSAINFGNFEASPSKDLLQSYLMADGSFYSEQVGFEENLFVDEFENRDPRLSQTYAFPGWELIRTETYSQGGGIYIQQLQKNFSGYHQIKGFKNSTNTVEINNVDYPVIRYAETLLTYAEAKAELGELTQGDLDMSVNLLRARAGMPNMVMGGPVDPVQQARYPGVDGDLLEIRRERRVELALEGYRMDDLYRWGAGALLEQEPEGLYFPGLGKYDLTGDGVEDIILIDVSESVPAGENKEVNALGATLIYYRVGLQDSEAAVYLENGTNGTVQTVRERGTFVAPKYYYRPIPQTHVTVNNNLNQIFGWD